MKKIVSIICLLLIVCVSSFAQPFTHADTLRGSNGRGRSWWNATKYDLHVKFNLQDSTISGYNEISFKVLKPDSIMQIDLQEPMMIDSMALFCIRGDDLYVQIFLPSEIKKDGNAYFINTEGIINAKDVTHITIYYHGKPKIAKHAPWDGGLIWTKDKAGNHARDWEQVFGILVKITRAMNLTAPKCTSLHHLHLLLSVMEG